MKVVNLFMVASLVTSVCGIALAQESDQKPQTEWTFDTNEPGKTPTGWRVAETKSSGKSGAWTVVADDGAPSKPNVVKLNTQADDSTFNLLVAEKAVFKDLDIRARVKAISGEVDQGGGLMWRVKDENNYYICRINPLEGNFRVYKVVDGKRTQLHSEKLETKTGQWYEIRAVMTGDHMECFVDGKPYLHVHDDTFEEAGMIGLWTKADASSAFDDVAVYAPPVQEATESNEE